MRIVFMGTPEFAVESLDSLIKANFNVVGVVTAPDKPAGRGQQLSQSAVKKYALEQGLTLLQPLKLKDPDFLAALEELKADVQFVVAFRMLPEVVWNMPLLGTYNLHASLLPRYRGAAPINWAVINGERETGVTTFKLKHDIDTGLILFTEKVPIHDRTTAGELHDVLMKKGSELLVKTARAIEKSVISGEALAFMPQEESSVTHAPKLFKETCKINWHRAGSVIVNLIRGLSPYPAAYTELIDSSGLVKTMKVYSGLFEACQHQNTNGSISTDSKNYIKVFCQDGWIAIEDLQLEGKKRMPIKEFLRGYKLGPEARFQ